MKSSSEIEEICDKYSIFDYIINEDGSIDVDGSVYLLNLKLTELPLEFNYVRGHFNCGLNFLTTLKGSPKYVGGEFYCPDNELTSLEFGPIEVGDTFSCSKNKLTSLEHSPKKVGGHFIFSENNIKDLYGISDDIGGFIEFIYTPLQSIIYKPVDMDFVRAFNIYRVIKDGKVVLKRLKYVMELFDMKYDLEKIKKYYEII